MLIEKLKLHNYRQYVDEEIEFSHRLKGKRITIIQGPNGSGKTNIINAITWCLYNKEMRSASPVYVRFIIFGPPN